MRPTNQRPPLAPPTRHPLTDSAAGTFDAVSDRRAGEAPSSPRATAGPGTSGAGLGVADLVVRYPSPGRGRPATVAVDEVSLEVAPGEIVALLGPSGSGKSSLLRAVAGLEPVAGGDVTWDGESVVAMPVHKRGFGLLFQDGQLFAHRDVAGNVGYGLRGSGKAADERIAELLELVGLPGEQRRDPATLSGGERQRVALARALAPRPRLLLLDEPLSALDRALRERLAADLRAALRATGTTAVLVTHDQDEAFAVADRVAVMDAGRLLQVAAPGELWRAPASRAVAAFLGYEAFVPLSSPAAAPFRAALGGTDDGADDGAVPAGDDATLALAAGALVVHGLAGGQGFIRAAGQARGVVVAVGARRGRSEVAVHVAGIGTLTALAPVGWTAAAGETVELAVDPDAVALLR